MKILSCFFHRPDRPIERSYSRAATARDVRPTNVPNFYDTWQDDTVQYIPLTNGGRLQSKSENKVEYSRPYMNIYYVITSGLFEVIWRQKRLQFESLRWTLKTVRQGNGHN